MVEMPPDAVEMPPYPEHFAGIWEIWLAFGRFCRDLADFARIWNSVFGFVRFGWCLGDFA